MTDDEELRHRCGWPSCSKLVPLELWGCRVHWYALPNPLRAWIRRAYVQGMADDIHPTLSYIKAHRAALDFIALYEAGKKPDHAMYGLHSAAYSPTNDEAKKE